MVGRRKGRKSLKKIRHFWVLTDALHFGSREKTQQWVELKREVIRSALLAWLKLAALSTRIYSIVESFEEPLRTRRSSIGCWPLVLSFFRQRLMSIRRFVNTPALEPMGRESALRKNNEQVRGRWWRVENKRESVQSEKAQGDQRFKMLNAHRWCPHFLREHITTFFETTLRIL